MGGRLDNELTLIACCIQENRLIDKAVLGGMTHDWFATQKWSILWRGITEHRNKGNEIDINWATDYLKRKFGHIDLSISTAIGNLVSYGQFDSCFEIMRRQYYKRKLERVLLDANQRIHIDEPEAVIKDLIQDIDTMQMKITKEEDSQKDIEKKILHHISTGVENSWGYHKLDHFTRGVEPYFYIIAGDSGHLKTTMAINMAYNVAKNNVPVQIFSGEMSGQLLAEKMAIMESGINTRYGIPAEHRDFFMECVRNIRELPIHISESVSLPRIRIEIAKKLRKIYIIDYLQLVKSDVMGRNREREISYIIEELARLRSEYKVCIIALSSLNRGERDKDHVPSLRNLKDSSSIEYGADYVWFMYYKWRIKTIRDEEVDEEEKYHLRTYMSKNRVYGYEGRIDFTFDEQSLRLKEKEE